MKKDILGLGLESSCDETGVSIVKNGKTILSNLIFSQIDIHKKYYGVVPEIASRAHLEVINPLIEEALKKAQIKFSDLDYVAATTKPGLIGSLLIALQSAKVISYTLGIPFIGINHLEAHLYAPFLEGYQLFYPYLGLLISGGNTILFKVKGLNQMEILAKTVDDAVGEAFDKIAKYLELGYPGGPLIENLAKTAQNKETLFPKILPQANDNRFSYSGLKTAVITYLKNNPEANQAEIVYSFQERALEILTRKTLANARKENIKKIVVAGGVAANGRLRELFSQAKNNDEEIIIASPKLCTDNAAMVAGLGYQYFQQNIFSSLDLDAQPKI